MDVLDYLIGSQQFSVLIFQSRYTRCTYLLKIRKDNLYLPGKLFIHLGGCLKISIALLNFNA